MDREIPNFAFPELRYVVRDNFCWHVTNSFVRHAADIDIRAHTSPKVESSLRTADCGHFLQLGSIASIFSLHT